MRELIKQHPVVIEQDVSWSDMDAYQHVNNAVYFRYFEDVRIAYFEKAGINTHMERTNQGPILASTRCDFRAPLRFPDRIRIATDVTETRDNRFTMKYIVYSEKMDKVVAEGEALVVYYNYDLRRSCQVPEPILAAMTEMHAGTEG